MDLTRKERLQARIGDSYRWLAWRLPRRLVFWCAVRLVVNATTAPYPEEQSDTLSWGEVIARWKTPVPKNLA